ARSLTRESRLTPVGRMRAVRVRAQPVVEIEEHRRALRRRTQQFAEAAEDVGTDRLALVLGQQEPVAALARIDVEMVEPEIRENFLQLPVAVDRAKHFLLAELDDDTVGLLLNLHLRRIRLLSRRVDIRAGSVLLPVAPGFEQRPLELLGDLFRAQVDGREAGETPLDFRIADAGGMKLLVDVALEADLPDAFDVSGTRTKADSVEHRDDRLVVGGECRS